MVHIIEIQLSTELEYPEIKHLAKSPKKFIKDHREILLAKKSCCDVLSLEVFVKHTPKS